MGPGARSAARAGWAHAYPCVSATDAALRPFLSDEPCLESPGKEPWFPEALIREHQPGRPSSVYLAGDSTCAHYRSSRAPCQGWGQAIESRFDREISVHNDAACGRSSKSFAEEARLASLSSRMRQGDTLFIAFGHNDEKPDERHTDPFTGYPEMLGRYSDAARARGALPVLLTPVQRRSFDEAGRFRETHGDYPEAVRQLARRTGTPLIDLARSSRELLIGLGAEPSKALFMPGDNTHFNAEGAARMAELVLEGLAQAEIPLARHILKEGKRR